MALVRPRRTRGTARAARTVASLALFAALAPSALAQSGPAALAVDPPDPFQSVGIGSAPPWPGTAVYTLTNTGGEPLFAAAVTSHPWIEVTPETGYLAPGASVPVTVRIPTLWSALLPPDVYQGQVWFANVTTGIGSTWRDVTLLKLPAGFGTGGDGGGSGSPGGPDDPGGGGLADGPVLQPGSGFSGPTPEPGAKSGSTARAIARWDVVPHQTVTGDFEVGVVAFHHEGIDRVEVSLEGGPWLRLSEMTTNPRTGVHEYWAVLRPSLLAKEGVAELRAIAYPKKGAPRVLPPLELWAVPSGKPAPTEERYVSPSGSDSNPGTKAKPMRTIWRAAQSIGDAQGGWADGGVVYLLAGDHDYSDGSGSAPRMRDRWLEVRPAPGLTKADVSIKTSSGVGLKADLVRLDGLTIRAVLRGGDGSEHHMWVSSSHFRGSGQHTEVHPVGWFTGLTRWITDSRVTDDRRAFRNAEIVRNVDAERIGADAYNQSGLVVNCTVDDVDPGSTGWHPDVYQLGSAGATFENLIVYGLRATNVEAQGIFAADEVKKVVDCAFVNVLIEKDAGSINSQWEAPADHLLLWNVTLVNQSFYWRTPKSTLKNVSVRGTCFQRMKVTSPGDGVDASWFEDVHYVDGTSYGSITPGTDVSTGDPLFLDPGGDDFRPKGGSPLKSRVSPLCSGVDAHGDARHEPATIGAYE